VVLRYPRSDGRDYRVATAEDEEIYAEAAQQLKHLEKYHKGEPSIIPHEPLPQTMGGVIGAANYGHQTWGHLFNARQLLSLITFLNLAREYVDESRMEDRGFAEAMIACLSLVVNRLADLNSSLCGWQLGTPNTAHTFVRWAIPMMMDFGEINPLSGAGGSPESVVRRTTAGIEGVLRARISAGTVEQVSATASPLPENSVDLFATDPPYYNAVPYADLSDFFYVWSKRCLLPTYHSSLFSSELSPKQSEICELASWDSARYPEKDKSFFESEMRKAMSEGRRILKPNGIGTIVFAHKSTAGWEALLQAVVDSGWIITASWPIDTEMGSRMRARDSAVLASSIHLVCRPRSFEEEKGELLSVGDWRGVLAELPLRIHEWMPRLANEGVVGADAIFACLGPALEVFSRYSRVEKASGEAVTLREYMEHVWSAVAKEALNMIFAGADATGFEEDARLTAMWLWTIKGGEGNGSGATGEGEPGEEEEESGGKSKPSGFSLEYDAARKIAQGLGAHLEALTGVVEVKGETARLLPVAERTRILFGSADADAPTAKRKKKDTQLKLSFAADLEQAEEAGGWGQKGAPRQGKTVLDRIHQAMILFAAGRGEALKRFLVEEGVGRDDRFWRLAQALSALYPSSSDEKRWVDGVLARKKGLGF